MNNANVYSGFIGINPNYTENSKMLTNDDTNYDAVDFCQGKETQDSKVSWYSTDDYSDEASLIDYSSNDSTSVDYPADDYSSKYSNDYSLNESLFNFDSEYDEDLG